MKGDRIKRIDPQYTVNIYIGVTSHVDDDQKAQLDKVIETARGISRRLYTVTYQIIIVTCISNNLSTRR